MLGKPLCDATMKPLAVRITGDSEPHSCTGSGSGLSHPFTLGVSSYGNVRRHQSARTFQDSFPMVSQTLEGSSSSAESDHYPTEYRSSEEKENDVEMTYLDKISFRLPWIATQACRSGMVLPGIRILLGIINMIMSPMIMIWNLIPYGIQHRGGGRWLFGYRRHQEQFLRVEL